VPKCVNRKYYSRDGLIKKKRKNNWGWYFQNFCMSLKIHLVRFSGSESVARKNSEQHPRKIKGEKITKEDITVV
jgi:hypothetical protein